MRLETFFEKFDQFADAPNAIVRMPRFILDLAVRGKLVSQDANDEPADKLLKRVQAEKEHLIKSGEIKKQVQLPPIAEDALPFSLPAGWTLSQLGDVAVCLDYMREPINVTERDLRIAGKTLSELFPYYGATQQQGWIDDFIFEAELVLLGEDGVPFFDDLRPKAYLISGKTWVNNHAHVFRGILVSNAYLMHWLNTFDYTGRVAGSTRSKLNQAKAVDIPIALPPLAEQKRIVAKVDELMAMCDQLEAQQRERDTHHAALAHASLARFAEAPTPANLDYLFHPSYAITPADLRKSILTLAVQGKLVPQDPNDEPAEALVARIAAALPNKKPDNPFLGEIEDSITEESKYELPPGWAWLPLGHVGIWATGCGFPMQYQGEADGEFLFCKVSDMNLPGNEVEIHKTVHSIDADVMKKIRARANPVGTVIFPKIGGAIATHKRRLVIKPTIIDNNCSGIQPIGLTDNRWLLFFMRSLDLTKYQSGTSVPAVSQGSLDPIRIGLPPLAEQRRIVAKVEQLMALVDALETQLAASRATAEKLIKAIIAELT